MKAILTFATRKEAENFAKNWSRFTLRGHTISSGKENVDVDVYDVTPEEKIWIDNYVSKLQHS